MRSTPIRVLLVEDSPIALVILKRLLTTADDIEVVGTARTGVEALQQVATVQPDVICTDLHMPHMGGLELTKRLMVEYPRPILVISASVQAEDTVQVFELLQAGAVDVFPKPVGGLAVDDEQVRRSLINKVRVLSGVKVFTQHRYRQAPVPSPVASPSVPSVAPPAVSPVVARPRLGGSNPRQGLAAPRDIRAPRLIAIGASTGGPNALYTVLNQLPPTLPVPVLCVQHISEGFLSGLVDWLNRDCALEVCIACPGLIPQAGTVYFAPEGQHLELDSAGRLTCTNTPAVSGHRPSVTALFNSVATVYRRSVVAVLLTGMGRDGADGLLAVSRAGGHTIAQDESSSVVFGMPKEAIALGAARQILPIDKIGAALVELVVPTATPSP